MTTYDFDELIDRHCTESAKWHRYDQDVLPMWVADMDFRSPEPVIQALRERVDHGVFGYGTEPPKLREVVVERLADLYDWQVSAEDLIFVPGVVTGFNLACWAVTSPGDGVLMQTPAYPPILDAPPNAQLVPDGMELTRQPDGRYTVDFAAFGDAITARTRIFILCNPQNPVGHVFQRDELERMAEICLRHNIVICSDEIHCDLVFQGKRHLPIASLDPEIASQAITLMAPSKTYNMAGLHCSVAIVQNPVLRASLKAARVGLVPDVNIMGYVAALAAYRDGQPWLERILAYLESNLDYLVQAVDDLPGINMTRPEATHLGWLDCRQSGIPGNPHRFFLQEAKVAVNDGSTFGKGGEGFVRLNFGCPRATLVEALDRIQSALSTLR